MAVANRMVAQGSLVLRDVAVPLEPIGAHVIHVSVYRLPHYVSEDALVQESAPVEGDPLSADYTEEDADFSVLRRAIPLLAINSDEEDVTSGQGQPPSTPYQREQLPTRSSPTGLASADNSTEDM
ncbi:hypothetical protein HPB47_001475 [Ixodes persulcatus]|uniref:Uncharacterized protein n=1 Tax=Ixodes persulcatus TaxID=34615 RepID=A0AC60PP22_IXOPE|nr:hypothetical protein HPB47_001475 [Ixodes persulcatus]